MQYQIKEDLNFKYLETQPNAQVETMLLLHGLFGALSNFNGIIHHFGKNYNVVIPMLPILDMPMLKIGLDGLVAHVADFVAYKGFQKMHILGNSLGGHIALLYALAYPSHIASLTLTGSSGLFENAFGSTFPRRGDYEFVRIKTADTFYDPAVATKELVDEVFDTVNDRGKAIRVIGTAKSAVRHNLSNKLHDIYAPTLLVWGKQDNVTPAFVGEQFHELIKGSKLVFVDKCGHAPMMEHPELFNLILEEFLEDLKK